MTAAGRAPGWNHADIMALLHRAEAEFPVDQWRLHGLRMWPVLRLAVFFRLYYQTRGAGEAPVRGKGTEKLLLGAKVAKCYFGDWHNNARIGQAADAVLLTYDVHRQRLGSVWYDRFCDRYVDELDALGWRSVVYELTATSNLHDCRIPRARPTVWVQPAVEAKALLARVLEHLQPTVRPSWFDRIGAWFRSCGVAHAAPGFFQLATAARSVNLLADWFERRLVALGTRVVFSVQYYNLLGYAANVACRRLGIPSVDIQHGVQGVHHAGYGGWQRVPADGYEMLPSLFWCWTQAEAQAIDRWAAQTAYHRTLVGGDLWLRGWQPIVDARAPIAAGDLAALKPPGTRLVLFTSSYADDLTDWILAAMRRSPVDVRWAVRLHPNHRHLVPATRERLDCEGLSGVDVKRATELPLPALLRHADVNVTSVSSVVIEAAQSQVPSVITDPTGLDVFANYVRAGRATGAFTEGDLLTAIGRYCRSARQPETLVDDGIVEGALTRFLSGLPGPAIQGVACS